MRRWRRVRVARRRRREHRWQHDAATPAWQDLSATLTHRGKLIHRVDLLTLVNADALFPDGAARDRIHPKVPTGANPIPAIQAYDDFFIPGRNTDGNLTNASSNTVASPRPSSEPRATAGRPRATVDLQTLTPRKRSAGGDGERAPSRLDLNSPSLLQDADRPPGAVLTANTEPVNRDNDRNSTRSAMLCARLTSRAAASPIDRSSTAVERSGRQVSRPTTARRPKRCVVTRRLGDADDARLKSRTLPLGSPKSWYDRWQCALLPP